MEEENLVKKENEVTSSNNSSNNNGIIAVLVVIIVALIGAVVYFAFIKPDDKPVNNNGGNKGQVTDNTDKTDEDDNLKPWMKYILEQNITKIEVSSVPCSEDSFDSKTVIINVNQLNDIFKKFMNYKLELSYGGGGGWTCGEELKISYSKNGQGYELRYLGTEGHIIPSSDGCKNIYDKDLENALYRSTDKIYDEDKNLEYACPMYALITSNLLFDEYFK